MGLEPGIEPRKKIKNLLRVKKTRVGLTGIWRRLEPLRPPDPPLRARMGPLIFLFLFNSLRSLEH